jgi:hypothetical protein
MYVHNTPRGLNSFASLHLTIFERPVDFEFFEQSGNWPASGRSERVLARREPILKGEV